MTSNRTAMTVALLAISHVSLIEHSSDGGTPAPTAWLLTGSVALGLVALVATMATLRDYARLPTLYRPVSAAMIGAAGAALVAGWWAPAPWLLALVLVAMLSAVWLFAVDRWLRLDDPEQALPGGG